MADTTLPRASGATLPPGTRRPHFRRHAPMPMRTTPDDIAIVRFVGKHRFRRSTDIVRHMSHRAPKKIVERLTELYHGNLLDRPRAQLDHFDPHHRAPYVYALGNKGAALLAELDDARASGIDWTDKNREAGRPFIDHALLIGDVMTAAARVMRARPDVLLLEPADILANAPEQTQRSDNPWRFAAPVPTDNGLLQDLAIIPDKAFGFDFTIARKRPYFFLEADCATMPVWRSNLQQSSMRKKFLVYHHGHAAQLHTARYGVGNFRVLTVTSSAERIASMIDAVKQITSGKGTNLFLFATAAAVRTCNDFLALPWTSGKGETVSLAG